ncbi:hypothetical protein ARMGADRAFT_729039 [Armillaria gallica]|uniref:Uncharacterized protein n=1 Tax=Armillaria gallica TaxID=47427 RepID=A0A2H3CI09_ARMGA|nr:hypothetical protein ARMGADRAFT_729039 [Armillaria gallica]
MDTITVLVCAFQARPLVLLDVLYSEVILAACQALRNCPLHKEPGRESDHLRSCRHRLSDSKCQLHRRRSVRARYVKTRMNSYRRLEDAIAHIALIVFILEFSVRTYREPMIAPPRQQL